MVLVTQLCNNIHLIMEWHMNTEASQFKKTAKVNPQLQQIPTVLKSRLLWISCQNSYYHAKLVFKIKSLYGKDIQWPLFFIISNRLDSLSSQRENIYSIWYQKLVQIKIWQIVNVERQIQYHNQRYKRKVISKHSIIPKTQRT